MSPTRGQPNQKIVILRHAPGLVRVQFPYDAELLDEIKNKLPSVHRRWDKDIKAWIINDAYLTELVDLLQAYWPDGDIQSDLTEPAQSSQTDWVAGLMAAVPPQHLERVQRALAFAFHPDTNPGVDPKIMQRINAEVLRRKIP